jgi:Flp pilus assembly protein TadG
LKPRWKQSPMRNSLTIRRTTTQRRRRGAATLEAALVLPVVITFLFGILEYGRYVMMLQVVTNASREGARYAVEHTSPVTINGVTYGNGTSDVTNAVTNAMAGVQLSSQQVQVYASDSLGNNSGTWTSAQPGQSICVRIIGNYPVILGKMLFLPTNIPVVAQSVMRSESN